MTVAQILRARRESMLDRLMTIPDIDSRWDTGEVERVMLQGIGAL